MNKATNIYLETHDSRVMSKIGFFVKGTPHEQTNKQTQNFYLSSVAYVTCISAKDANRVAEVCYRR